MELNRNVSGQATRLEAARVGLRKLLKQGRVASAAVLACPELTQLATWTERDEADDSTAATVVTEAILRAVEHAPERSAMRALLGIDPSTEGHTLRERRRVAAELVDVTPESFRVRRESRLFDELAHALLIELSPPAQATFKSTRPSTTVLLLGSKANRGEAMTIYERLEREADIEVTWDAIDLRPYPSPKSLAESIREYDAVVHLISVPFLRSRSCMRELLPLIKDDSERNHYRQRAIPMLIEDEELDLFHPGGQLMLVDYWMDAKMDLEEQINARGEEFGPALDEIRGDLTIFRDIAEHIMRFLRTATENIYATSYSAQEKLGFLDVVERSRDIGIDSRQRALAAPETEPPRRFTALRLPGKRPPDLDETKLHPEHPTAISPPEIERLAALHDSIVVASESDPERPEFPPFSPRFPATPAYPIEIPQLGREITIKDESHNFTGSHKDRMAWEIVVYYKSIIQDLLSPHAKSLTLPSPSIISNGSAAMAIQVMLRCFDLPRLKVLIDERTDQRIVRKLERAGCEVFSFDLSKRELASSEVLQLTENEDGFDVTARSLVDPTRRTYYDWLAYEILNCNADHIFIPVGTGDLYVNVLTVLRDELMGVTNDRRLAGGSETIEGIEVYGATSEDRKTKMDKLYAHYRPTLVEAQRVVDEMRDRGFCGAASNIYNVRESIVAEALKVARTNGVRCDESGIAGLSLLLQLKEEGHFQGDGRILVVNTGWLAL
jgi:threonine dehydratase